MKSNSDDPSTLVMFSSVFCDMTCALASLSQAPKKSVRTSCRLLKMHALNDYSNRVHD